MGRVSTCQNNCNTIDLRRAQVNDAGNLYKKRHCHNIAAVGLSSKLWSFHSKNEFLLSAHGWDKNK